MHIGGAGCPSTLSNGQRNQNDQHQARNRTNHAAGAAVDPNELLGKL
jgi:hypothetical protein